MASITPEELVAYASEDFPGLDDDFDNVASGGAINPKMRIIFTDIPSGTDWIKAETSSNDNTGNLVVYGRASDGTKVMQSKALSSKDSGNFTYFNNFGSVSVIERILAVIYVPDDENTVAAANINIYTGVGGAYIGTVYQGEKGFTRLFINAYSDINAGKDYYMKFFWKNRNSTNTLINAIVKEAGESTTTTPNTSLIQFGLASTINDSFSISRRVWDEGIIPTGGLSNEPLTTYLTIPTSNHDNRFLQTGQIAVPGSNLPAGAAIGVWLKFRLATSAAPVKGIYTSQLFGLST